MNFDIYHAQIGEGNLIELLKEALPIIGEIQVADVPGRKEPGTGEIHYNRVLKEAHDLGYRDFDWMQQDTDLDVLKTHPAFLTLLGNLKAHS